MQNVHEISSNVFELRLTVGYGNHLISSASLFTPAPPSELNSSVAVEVEQDMKLSRCIVRPTPLVTNKVLDTSEMSKQLDDWAEDIIAYHLDGWPDFCYAHLGWEREILAAVCRYFADLVHFRKLSETDSMLWPSDLFLLKQTLKVSILMFLLGHRLIVPEEDKERLGEALGTTLPQGPVSLKLVNSFVKMALVPMVRSLVHDLFDGIDTMLRTFKGPHESSIGFCMLMLLLMVIAGTEIALGDVTTRVSDCGDVSRSRAETSAEIQEIDRQLSQVLIGLFRARFKWQRGKLFSDIKNLHKRSNDPTERLVLRLSEVTISHGTCDIETPPQRRLAD
jgi:hypothetical protein